MAQTLETTTAPDIPVDAAVVEGRRERKKRETRAALASAALRLAAAHGPENVTIEQIADAADVSPRTFFNYFASKEEAIVNWNPERAKLLRARLEARPVDEPVIASLAAVHRETAADDETAGDWAMRMELVRHHPSLFPRYVAMTTMVEQELIDVVAERTGLDATADLYPRLIVAATGTAARVAVIHWHTDGQSRPLVTLMDDAFDQLTAGLARVPDPR